MDEWNQVCSISLSLHLYDEKKPVHICKVYINIMLKHVNS